MRYEFKIRKCNPGRDRILSRYSGQYYFASIGDPKKSLIGSYVVASKICDTAAEANHFLREQATFLGIDFGKVNIIREIED